MATFLDCLLEAMAKEEGFGADPQNRPTRNRNPLDVWDGMAPGKTHRIWPKIPVDDGGFLQFGDPADGWALARKELLIKIGRGVTLRQLVDQWTETDRASYLAGLVASLDIDADQVLAPLVDEEWPKTT